MVRMVIGRPRDKARREARLQEIVQIAAELMHERGYSGVSLKRLAKKVGVTEPALYYYFGSKRELLYLIVSHSVNATTNYAERILQSDIPAELKLRHMITKMAMEVLDNLPMFAIYFRDKDHLSAKHRALMVEKERRLMNVFAVAYREGIKEGKIDSQYPEVDILIMFGAVSWCYRWWKPGRSSSEDMSKYIAHVLLSGILTRNSKGSLSTISRTPNLGIMKDGTKRRSQRSTGVGVSDQRHRS